MNRSLARAAARSRRRSSSGAVAGGDALAGGDAALDDLGELALLLGVEQRDGADLIEVLTNGITHVGLFNTFGAVPIPADPDFREARIGKLLPGNLEP